MHATGVPSALVMFRSLSAIGHILQPPVDGSAVARRPIADMDAYRERLQSFVYASGTTMKPIFTAAKKALKK